MRWTFGERGRRGEGGGRGVTSVALGAGAAAPPGRGPVGRGGTSTAQWLLGLKTKPCLETEKGCLFYPGG